MGCMAGGAPLRGSDADDDDDTPGPTSEGGPRPKPSGRRPPSFSTAMSLSASKPTSVASHVELSERVTDAERAARITWKFVT